MTLAEQVYSHLFGHLDDKQHAASKVQAIADWIKEGHAEAWDVEDLAAEWAEIDDDPELVLPEGEDWTAELNAGYYRDITPRGGWHDR